METEEILEKMRILNGNANRKILELLLQGPKDFSSLRRESKMSRSTVFDSLKTLMNVDIVERKKLQDQPRGRPAYEYSVKDFYLPELTKTNLLDFLRGMNLDAKSVRLIDLSVLDHLIKNLPISIEFILYMMISSGFKFNHAFQILLDLRPTLKGENGYKEGENGYKEGENGYKEGENGYKEGENGYKEIIDKIIEIAESRYPIDKMTLDMFREKTKREIHIISEKEEKILTLNTLKNIALSELQTMEFEADYLAQDTWMTLVIMGIYEIEYPPLVNFMYILAKNTKMICKRPPYFHQVMNLPNFDVLKFVTFIENDKKINQSKEISWSSKEISKYLERKMNFNKAKCNLLANIVIEKLFILGLEKYNIDLLDSLVRELIRELKI